MYNPSLLIIIVLSLNLACQQNNNNNGTANLTNHNPTQSSTILVQLSNDQDGDHTSPIFQLNKPAILRYKYQPKMFDTGGFTVCLMPEGSKIDTDGCLPEVLAMYGEESEILIDKPKGKYYLLVQAINAKWEIVLEEKTK